MSRDDRDIWPDNVPIGAFHIRTPISLAGRSATAVIMFVCPNGKRCGVFLGPQFEAQRNDDEPNVWAWDGNADRPTITPSINCITEKDGKPTGGCGWHGFITAGEIRP